MDQNQTIATWPFEPAEKNGQLFHYNSVKNQAFIIQHGYNIHAFDVLFLF